MGLNESMRHKIKLKRIEPRRSGRPIAAPPMDLVRDLRRRGASVRQIRDMLRLSHGTAQRAVSRIDADMEFGLDSIAVTEHK